MIKFIIFFVDSNYGEFEQKQDEEEQELSQPQHVIFKGPTTNEPAINIPTVLPKDLHPSSLTKTNNVLNSAILPLSKNKKESSNWRIPTEYFSIFIFLMMVISMLAIWAFVIQQHHIRTRTLGN